jgi:hypothetical protein
MTGFLFHCWPLSSCQVLLLVRLAAYGQEIARSLAVIFLQMESCWPVLDMTRRYGACYC